MSNAPIPFKAWGRTVTGNDLLQQSGIYNFTVPLRFNLSQQRLGETAHLTSSREVLEEVGLPRDKGELHISMTSRGEIARLTV